MSRDEELRSLARRAARDLASAEELVQYLEPESADALASRGRVEYGGAIELHGNLSHAIGLWRGEGRKWYVDASGPGRPSLPDLELVDASRRIRVTAEGNVLLPVVGAGGPYVEVHPSGALLASALVGFAIATSEGVFRVKYVGEEAPTRRVAAPWPHVLAEAAASGDFVSAALLAGQLRRAEPWVAGDGHVGEPTVRRRATGPAEFRGPSGREWLLVHRIRDGHKMFLAPDAGRWAIGGPSGATPETYEDGLLWVDARDVISVAPGETPDSPRPCAYSAGWGRESAQVPLLADGSARRSWTLEPFAGGLWMAWRLGMFVTSPVQGAFLVLRD